MRKPFSSARLKPRSGFNWVPGRSAEGDRQQSHPCGHSGGGKFCTQNVRGMSDFDSRKIHYYTVKSVQRLPQYRSLSADLQLGLQVVGRVLPFRVNSYVVDELIDWANVPDDPIFRLTFMHPDMLTAEQFGRVADGLKAGLTKPEMEKIANQIRLELNPHPAGQMSANVPVLDDRRVEGIQHKYRETCLVFPRAGQTCHSYCTFCFRWPQFVGLDGYKFATDESRRFQAYIRSRKEVTDVLFTGGDPMVMNARRLNAYVRPLLGEGFEHVSTIRIGTKSVAYWPYRYVTDRDADDVLSLFEEVVSSGKHLALMAHYSHWRELDTPIAREAIRRIRNTGAEIRTQSPVIRRVNDDAEVWFRMWKEQVRLGCIPYYMFIERDTGAKQYFSVPLERTWRIYRAAVQRLSGLGRTARGPCMSAYPGKICVDGVTEVAGERVFALRLLQARNPDYVNRPFFARFDPQATWLSDLRPAFGRDAFFFDRGAAGDGSTFGLAPWRQAARRPAYPAHRRKRPSRDKHSMETGPGGLRQEPPAGSGRLN